ncbi:FtsX-like permease family protein, partial [Siminovitchia terrae]|uniref:FtsX-like permease family protein n=1 Tax=Siminovitchia terrae TaxID=1914933 RepID=UPI0028AC911D
PRYPWKFKNQFNPKWVDETFSNKGKKLTLSLGNWNGKRQIALVLGWQDRTIRKMIYIEGALIGLLGGILGVVFSIVILHFMYQTIAWNELWVFLTGLIVLVFVGVISAAIPGRKIIKIDPSMGLKQRYLKEKIHF